MRLIDADEFKESLDDIKIIIDEDVLKCENIHEQLVYLLNKVEDAIKAKIDEAPTIEARPVAHGEWVRDGDFWICLNCESEINVKNSLGEENRKNFCPNCGAEMDGKAV